MTQFSYMDMLSELGIGGAHPGGIKATEIMLDDEPINQDTIILDAGCGTGQTSAYLYSAYQADIIALDAHPVMVQKAEDRFSQLQLPIKVIKASLEAIPLTDHSVHYCLAESVLSFVDIESVLKEMKRVLKPGGVLYGIELTIQKPLAEIDRIQIGEFYGFKQMWNEDRWEKALRNAGFTDVQIRPLPSFYDEEEPLTEFQPSENVPDAIFDLLDRHEKLLHQYQEAMGYRIIRAQNPE